MNETEKAAIETELALREKLLAHKQKKQELNRETWRRIGVFLGACLVFALCAAVIVSVFFCSEKFDAIWKKYAEKDLWIPVIAMILKGVFVLTALGVAAFMGSRLARERE